jgi:hypothetical protein
LAQTPEQQPDVNIFVRVWKWVAGTWVGRVIGVAFVLALILSLYWWPESGFDQYQGADNFQRLRTLWDWLDLLGVPVVLAVGGFAFSRAERKNEQDIAARQTEEERERADERAKLERELADKRADDDRKRADDALRQDLVQDYLDRMSELLLDKNLATSKPDDLVREVARARTLTVLRGLGEDGARKGYIIQFLHETGLTKGRAIITLKNANLQWANISYADLTGVNLHGVDLGHANLLGAKLSGADLSGAGLNDVGAYQVDFKGANLNEAWLVGAQLWYTDLSGADLTGAILLKADLRGANLTNTAVIDEQLAQSLSLEGATMPDGTMYAGVPPTAGAPVTPSLDSAL